MSLVSRVSLGPTGLDISRLVLGVWRLADDPDGVKVETVSARIKTSLELGISTFDHADIYGDYSCEQHFGAALAAQPSLREKMQLVTKCGIKLLSKNRPHHRIKHYDTGRAHLLASVDNSLRCLRTDRLDLLLIHRPDPLMDADEVAEAFNLLHASGKVLHFGVSNFTPCQYDLLASRVERPLVTNQVELSVLRMNPLNDGTMDHCQRHRVRPMAWSPLGGGRLFVGQGPQESRVREALKKVGDELGGATLDQVALAWLLAMPAKVIPVLGTGDLTRIRLATECERLPLSREQWFEIWSASAGHEVP